MNGVVGADINMAAIVEDYDKVKQAYKEYREAGNPPILGEDGDEIVYE